MHGWKFYLEHSYLRWFYPRYFFELHRDYFVALRDNIFSSPIAFYVAEIVLDSPFNLSLFFSGAFVSDFLLNYTCVSFYTFAAALLTHLFVSINYQKWFFLDITVLVGRLCWRLGGLVRLLIVLSRHQYAQPSNLTRFTYGRNFFRECFMHSNSSSVLARGDVRSISHRVLLIHGRAVDIYRSFMRADSRRAAGRSVFIFFAPRDNPR